MLLTIQLSFKTNSRDMFAHFTHEFVVFWNLIKGNFSSIQSAHVIEGKCIVHTFKNYTKLENVGFEDYFFRFKYKAATGGFTLDHVALCYKCEMPYNPDDLMVQCEGCKDWFCGSCNRV
ncbi:Chromatin remodeling protein EBS [Camellia lanceoleosa]|uniref:Chromatin remodeling protein EBS n=1 Tax=Camellia lanceoleosa TaxID=1840588 RepID=A0ACC0IDV2_9ERIC|nr:Chromatin remodeling protein EBS [Camellia lanceoleosa]